MRRGRRWLRKHVEIIAMPGDRTSSVTARTSEPAMVISLRRHPATARVTIEEVRR